MIEKLNKLIGLVDKDALYIEINVHRDFEFTIEEYLKDENYKSVEPEILQEMIKRDTLIQLQVYARNPNVPAESHNVHHYDLEEAIDAMIKIITNESTI